MRRLLRLLLIAFLTFIFVKATTFGWKFFAPGVVSCIASDNALAGRLENHVLMLSETLGNRDVFEYEHLKKAAEYISDEFRRYGYKIELQSYVVAGRKVSNIIAVKQGSRLPNEVIIVGAHYDSCANPGADDNASGVAVLLELARKFFGQESAGTVKWIAFVNEEPPFSFTESMGSRVYTRQAKAAGEQIRGAVILESVGYYNSRFGSQRYPPFFGPGHSPRGNFIAVVGNFASARLVSDIAGPLKRSCRLPIESTVTFGFLPGIYFSDHWSFWQEGYQAVMITDTAFVRNPSYHKSSDTPKTLNYSNMACLTEGLGQVIRELTDKKEGT